MPIVKIPAYSRPFVVIVNGIRYEYEPGKEVNVPDAVAAVIREWEKAHADDYAPEQDKTDELTARLKSGKVEDAELHLGFYLDENGDLCQKED